MAEVAQVTAGLLVLVAAIAALIALKTYNARHRSAEPNGEPARKANEERQKW